MTKLETWLKSQREILAAATKGPWHTKSEGTNIYCKGDPIMHFSHVYVKDQEFIAQVRTEHGRAIKLIEHYRNSLELLKQFDEVRSNCILALAYFPEVDT